MESRAPNLPGYGSKPAHCQPPGDGVAQRWICDDGREQPGHALRCIPVSRHACRLDPRHLVAKVAGCHHLWLHCTACRPADGLTGGMHVRCLTVVGPSAWRHRCCLAIGRRVFVGLAGQKCNAAHRQHGGQRCGEPHDLTLQPLHRVARPRVCYRELTHRSRYAGVAQCVRG